MNKFWSAWLWGALIAAAACCAGIFAYGVWTQHRMGDAQIPLNPTLASGWQQSSFRVIGDDEFSVSVDAINHAPPFGLPFQGTIELRVLDPDGKKRLHHFLQHGATELPRPDNYAGVHIGNLTASGVPWRSWSLQARVTDPDPAFDGVQIRARIDRAHPELGLAGVLLFVMVVPAALLAMIAVFPAMHLRNEGGSGAPLGVTVALLIGILLSMFAIAL